MPQQPTQPTPITPISSPPRIIDYKSPKTGKTYSFDWNKDTDPTPDDFTGLQKYVDSQEPDTPASAPVKSQKSYQDQMSDVTGGDINNPVGQYIRQLGKSFITPPVVSEGAEEKRSLNQTPEEAQAEQEQFKKYLSQKPENPITHPYHAATAAANLFDPTGMTGSMMGLGESAVGHIKSGEYAKAAVDAAALTMPLWLHGGEGKVPPVEAPIEPPGPPKQLTTIAGEKPNVTVPPASAPRALLGPPREPITPISTQRFPVDPSGQAIDLQDPSTIDIFGKKDNVYPLPPKSFHDTVGDPSQANAIPPIDSLPKVDTSVVAGGVPETGLVAKARPTVVPPVEQPTVTGTPPVDMSSLERQPKFVGSGTTIPKPPNFLQRLLGSDDTGAIGPKGEKPLPPVEPVRQGNVVPFKQTKLPAVEPIGGTTGRVAPFKPTSEEYQSIANKDNVIMGGVRPERGVPVVHDETLGGYQHHVRGNENWVTHPMLDKPAGPFKTPEEAFDWSLNHQETPEFQKYLDKGRELPPVTPIDRPQEMKVREGGYSGTEDRPVGPVIINPKTGRPNIAMGGADPQVLRQLGTSLYTKDRPSVLIQELMQNTVDEMKIAKVQKPIRVAFTENTKNPVTSKNSKSIIFQDFGRGMNESQLYNEFSDVGKSGKRDVEGAAGGFGFAKAAPFLGGDHMRTESVTVENGQKVKYTFGGKPEEFLNQEVGVPLEREVVPNSTPTGMRVEVFFPENKSFYNARDLLKTITESSPDIKDVETFPRHRESDTASPTSVVNKFTREGAAGLSDVDKANITTYQGKPLPPYQDTISTPENDAKIYYGLDNKERTGTKLIFLNNGVYYHAENQGAALHPIPHVPERVIIDVKSKVKEGHDKYPFPANRQGLNEEVKAEYRQWIHDNVIKPAIDKQENEIKNLYDRTKPKSGMNHVILDSGERYTPEELKRVENSPALKNVANVMGDLLHDLEASFDKDEELVGTTDKFGYRIGELGSGGMNISDPATSQPDLKTLVTINPFDAIYTGMTKRSTYRYSPRELLPAEAARRFVHLIKHEFAHNLARNEGAGFTWAFSQVDTRFGDTPHYEAQILKAITDRSGNYAPEIPQLLQDYLESRRRPESKEDILARQAASIKDETGREPEGVPGSNKPDGEGITPPVEPIESGPREPIKNWGGTPETVTFDKGGKLSPKGRLDFPSETDLPISPSAPPKGKLAERFGLKPEGGGPRPPIEPPVNPEVSGLPEDEPPNKNKYSGKVYQGGIDPNKLDVTYPKRRFFKDNAELQGELDRRAAVKTKEATPTFKDPGAFKTNVASPHNVLLNNPMTEPIARPIMEAYDKKVQWYRAKLDEASKFVGGLGESDRVLVGKALDTGDLSNLSTDLSRRTLGIKKILDKIHTEFPEGKKVGYIKNYLTRIVDEPKQGVIGAVSDLFKDKEMSTKGETGTGDMYDKGLGTPDSPYIKKRTGKLKDYDYDVRNVLPKYLDSIGKVIFDEPAVAKAKRFLEHVPDSNLKELGEWYIKDYTGYDSEGNLHKAFAKVASKVANTTARAFVDFNPVLHALHAGEIPVNIWPELGTKYTKHGIGEVIKNPVRTWNETAKLGLIQGETKPLAFRTKAEKWQSVASFFNVVEKFVKGTGYEGAKKMYIDKGFSPEEASKKAVELTKNMTLDTGPTRRAKVFSNESNIAGGEITGKLGGQFKGVPLKIAEQIYNVAKNSRTNKAAAARMIAGAAAMIYATKKGAHLFHLSPASLLQTTALGATGTALNDIVSEAYKGNYESAIENALAWTVPGGQAFKGLYEKATDKASRDKARDVQRAKEGRMQEPPVNTPKRAVDYVFK